MLHDYVGEKVWAKLWLMCMYMYRWGTALVARVGKSHFICILPLPTSVQWWQNTFIFILLFSNIERGNGGAGTYSVGIMVMSLCFWHFPTQFVHDYSYITALIKDAFQLETGAQFETTDLL